MAVTANRMDGTASIIALPELVERERISLGIAHPHGVALPGADSDIPVADAVEKL